MNTDDDSQDMKLLTDADFVELMDAAFEAESRADSQAENELEKARVWKNISEHVFIEPQKANAKTSPKTKLRSRLFSTAAMLAILMIPLSFFMQSDYDERIKGDSEFVKIDTHLFAYFMDNNGETIRSTGKGFIGDTLLFKVSLSQSAHVGLIIIRNSEAPELRFVSDDLAAKGETLIQKYNNAYGYLIESGDKELRFCSISGLNRQELRKRADNFIRNGLRPDKNACVNIIVGEQF